MKHDLTIIAFAKGKATKTSVKTIKCACLVVTFMYT